MRNSIFNRKIPTYLAIILLVFGLSAIVFLAQNTTSFQGRAAPDEEPKNIQISNVTANSFTLSYVTDSDVLGSIQYGTSERNRPNQETSGTDAKRLHVITVSGLNPETTYYFTIASGRSEFTDNGSPFVIKTGKTLDGNPSTSQTVSGKILNPDGSNGSNVIVYLTADNANIVSTQTQADGTFTFNLSGLLTQDLSSYYPLQQNQKMSLSSVGSLGDAKALFSLENSNPLPDITLNSVYNFTIAETDSAVPADENTVSFPVFRDGATETQNVTIVSPQNNEGFTDQQPSFEGTALPNEQVEIIIQSNHEIQTMINADDTGIWTFRPDSPIEPGEHTITVRTRDENGILRILTRSFTVYAQGSQFTEPSVSPPSPSPTATPTTSVPTPTLTITPSPTLIQGIDEPTPTPLEEIEETPTPTLTPLPLIEEQVTPQPTVEPTGSSSGSVALVSSFAVLLIGTFFYLFSRMKSL